MFNDLADRIMCCVIAVLIAGSFVLALNATRAVEEHTSCIAELQTEQNKIHDSLEDVHMELFALNTKLRDISKNEEQENDAAEIHGKTEQEIMTEAEEVVKNTASVAKLRDDILQIANVDIMIDGSSFKSTYQILDEISKKWGDLADIDVELFEVKPKKVGIDVDLPNLPTDRKVCTDYRVYNIPGTPHNRMQQLAWTDSYGCRRYGEYYIVGLGSAYANRIGEVFEVELDTGTVFFIITGDMKPDDDTDATNRFEACYNYDGEYCANVLEFIMDKEIFDIKAYQWGGVDYYEKFKGNIVRMTYLGRDTSADWDTYM